MELLVVSGTLERSKMHVLSSLVYLVEPGRPSLVGPPGFDTMPESPNVCLDTVWEVFFVI